ncbi:MAG: tetratricopeptide repeat protein [Deltaproteobacteria bacterium]|nr:tetratricopeptide repeat protein [Deltaproteobacteria bacterium]
MHAVALFAAALLSAASPPPEAQRAKDQADALKKQGDVSGAEAAYKQAIALFPMYALAHNDYGSLLFENGRVPEAIGQFQEATKGDPDYAIAWFNLGFASRKTGAYAEAVKAYQKYVTLKPDDTDGWYGLGESCRNAGQKECAITGYKTYLDREHRPSEQKWIDKAHAYLADLQPQNAPAPATTSTAVTTTTSPTPTTTAAPVPTPIPSTPAPATTVAPTAVAAASSPLALQKISQGDQLFSAKQFRDALFAYQDAVNADPANVEALFDLGKTYAVMGYYPQAIDRWQRVVELAADPGVKQRAQENIAKAQAKVGITNSPPATPTSAPAPQPTVVPAATGADAARQHYEEGVALINQRQYQPAIDALNASLQASPGYALAMAARGSAHVGLRQYPEAVDDYQSALRLDPNMATPLFGAAEAFRALGRKQDAKLYYQRYADSRAPDVSPQLQDEARRRVSELGP